MTFDSEKKRYTEALKAEVYSDKSKKGSVDVQIIPLLNCINAHDNYYTTSSCAGRIVLVKLAPSGKKNETEWLFVSHDTVSQEELNEGIAAAQTFEETTFFRQQPAIIHVCCKTLESADTLLQIARESGFKHSGILSTTKRIIVQLLSSENLDAPVAQDKQLLIPEGYLATLIVHANARLTTTRNKMKRLEQSLTLS